MRPRPLAVSTAAIRSVAVIGAAAVTLVAGLACSSERDDATGFRAVDGAGSAEIRPPRTTTEPVTATTEPAPARSTTTSTSSTTSSTTSTSTSTSTTTTTIDPLTVRHVYPIDLAVNSSWTPEAHANYRASDVFASTDCGTPLLAVIDGTVDDVMLDTYDRANDDPALRGGNAVSIIGVDGVRYYYAHFESIDPAIEPGATVTAGQTLGLMGDTGRAGACHLHFGLSLACADEPEDWWIRRGVIWPDAYLAAWKAGETRSPLPELQEWFANYPDACRSVEDTPYPRG